jgi:hypothetical protein
MKIYVASSWRNLVYPGIVHALKRCGHDVYDFRNPPGGTGFNWSQTGYELGPFGRVSVETYRKMISTDVAEQGYRSDLMALESCHVVVGVLPFGRSASWECGYAMANGKDCYLVAFDDIEPDLMFRESRILTTMADLFDVFGEPK